MEMMELSLQSHPLDFLEQPALFLDGCRKAAGEGFLN